MHLLDEGGRSDVKDNWRGTLCWQIWSLEGRTSSSSSLEDEQLQQQLGDDRLQQQLGDDRRQQQ
jgi:hypothetical protein